METSLLAAGMSLPGLHVNTMPSSAEAKNVSFELLLPQSPQHRARLPMRVNIYPHDTTDSIITTVRNFYGLYENKGVSFEDHHGNTLIARYENFTKGMTVYVRVIAGEQDFVEEHRPLSHISTSPRKPRLDEPFQMLPPIGGQPGSRPSSRMARRRSNSPSSGRGRRSTSASTNSKSRSRPGLKSRASSSHAGDPYGDAANGYSDSDGGNCSVTSSRREQVASAEISVENIVEGGRRKRAKFDSSELPLFVPPQVPMSASISSVSPQRRISSHNGASPFSYSNQQTFSYTHPLPSPQSYGHGEVSYLHGLATPYSTTNGHQQGHRSRTRGSASYVSARHSVNGIPILPTPDPTIGGSVISDEDVALQLMRLGDASNFSTHGRTSTSTLDDALSGKAEVSSEEESEDGSELDDQELPDYPPDYASAHSADGRVPHSVEIGQGFDSADTSGDEYEDNRDGSFKGESDEIMPEELSNGQRKIVKTKAGSISGSRLRTSTSLTKLMKGPRSRGHSKSKPKSNAITKAPISPASLPPQSRKPSNASIGAPNQFAPDEEDLSTKPRCQRCRKSKKGCDRQRPCQRCKDAGIGIDGCISEDEGNGRKGRYGRHMGVPVKKGLIDSPSETQTSNFPSSVTLSPGGSTAEKNKKRKR